MHTDLQICVYTCRSGCIFDMRIGSVLLLSRVQFFVTPRLQQLYICIQYIACVCVCVCVERERPHVDTHALTGLNGKGFDLYTDFSIQVY